VLVHQDAAELGELVGWVFDRRRVQPPRVRV
jgi:hypothetical protein